MTVGRPAPGPQDATTPRRRPSGRGPLLVGLGLSLAVHLLFLVFYARLGAPIIPGVPFASPLDPSERAFDGTQVIRIVEVTGEPAAEAPETDPTSEPTSPDAVEPDQAPSDEREQGPALPGRPGRAAADVLRAQEEDSVIWRRVDPELARLTDLEEARLRLRWSAADWNAARDAEARAAREALDWTYTDEEGNRWGVADGKIYLGKLVLPGAYLFAQPEGRNPEYDRLQQDLRDIDRAAARGAALEAQKERAKAIREREDREREEKKEEKADTAGVARRPSR